MDMCVLLDSFGMFVDNVKHWLNSYVSSLQSELKAKIMGQTIVCKYLFSSWAFDYLFFHHYLILFDCWMNVMLIKVANLAFQWDDYLFSLWLFEDWSSHYQLPTFLLHDIRPFHVLPFQSSKTTWRSWSNVLGFWIFKSPC
jgi:hypothetical protein